MVQEGIDIKTIDWCVVLLCTSLYSNLTRPYPTGLSTKRFGANSASSSRYSWMEKRRQSFPDCQLYNIQILSATVAPGRAEGRG